MKRILPIAAVALTAAAVYLSSQQSATGALGDVTPLYQISATGQGAGVWRVHIQTGDLLYCTPEYCRTPAKK
jgi:hypothetical protein